jgi:hypothetical protein
MGLITLGIVGARAPASSTTCPTCVVHAPDAGRGREIATWTKITCAVVMALGTATGGWRIIKTLGHKLVKLHPIHGFAAENELRDGALARGALRHAGIDHAQHFDRDHGRGLRQESKGPALDRRGAHRLGLAAHAAATALMAFLLVRLAMGMGWIS